MNLAIVSGYLVLVLVIGLVSHRFFRGTGEDYFVATRTIGPFLLLMSLFGTHMTAFSLLGASGEAYHRGIGVFALMASSSALVVPVVFLFVGTRIWALGKRFGYLTQIEFFRERWQSPGLGRLLFVVLVALLIPYLLIGIKGGGITLHQITSGRVPEWAGSLAICLVVLAYVVTGGLRGTAWANTFQTLVFMSLGAAAFVVILSEAGGLAPAMSRVSEASPELLVRGERIRPLELLTYTFMPLSVGMFPHIFMHWLTARRARTFRLAIVAYPILVAIVWLPSVLLGVLGASEFPGLEGPAANSILLQMIGRHAPGAMAGLLAAGVLAAVMSSLDSQSLALGTLFTRELTQHRLRTGGGPTGERQTVLLGRWFVAAVLLVTFLLSTAADRSIFKLGVWSFSGFAALFPLVVAALYWRRSTRQGAIASVLTVAALWIAFFVRGWQEPGYTVGDSGVMPVAVLLAASTAVLVLVSLGTPRLDTATLRRFFPERSPEESLESRPAAATSEPT
ncbi:MAG: sodium:solute symporter family protein [Thermoanaerobaculia bacterium]